MSCARVTAEWVCKEIKYFFTTVDFNIKMKVQETPVECMYLAVMLFYNIKVCLYPP